jgi:SAM-dependent MidA family methyltransferase
MPPGFLDMDHASEPALREALLHRASIWNFRSLSLADRDELAADPNQQLLYLASLGDVFAASQDSKRSTHLLEKTFRKVGFDAETIAFAKDYVHERSRMVVRKLALSAREDRRRLAVEFLDLALHARQEVAVCLFLARRLATLSGLDWKGLLRERAERRSDYEKALIACVKEDGGTVPFDRFFEHAMFNPLAGTYTGRTADHLISPDPASSKEAFFTTAATDPILARALLNYARGAWERAGSPERFDLVEMGAGMGTLAEGILEKAEALPGNDRFQRALRYIIVEKSPALARIQRERLARFNGRLEVRNRSALHAKLPEVPVGMFFSNELVDMFPPRKVVNRGGRLAEVYVSYRGGLFQEVDGPVREETGAYLRDRGIALAPGETYYIQRDIDGWVASLAEALGRGEIVTIDYGERRNVLRRERHEFGRSMFRGFLPKADPKVAFGLVSLKTYCDSPTGVARPKDMTVDVDFSALEEAVDRTPGLAPAGYLPQREFTRVYGGEEPKLTGFYNCRVLLTSKRA